MSRFPDVPEGHWAEKVVEEAAEDGILSGIPEGGAILFKGGQPVTRYELAAVADRLLGYSMGRITGTTTPGAAVVFQGPQRKATTAGGDGSYRSPRLKVGAYRVEFSNPGYVTKAVDGVQVAAGAETRLDVLLEQDQPGPPEPPEPSGESVRFLVAAYAPNPGSMGGRPDAEIVAEAGPNGVVIIQTSMIQAGRVAGLRAAAATKGWPLRIWLYELPQIPASWMTFYAEANAHPDWWVRNSAGQRLVPLGSAPDRKGVLDFTVTACRAFIVDHLLGWIEANVLDGYFNDGAASLQAHWGWSPSAPTSAQVDAHRLGNALFAEDMKARLGARPIFWNDLVSRFRMVPGQSGYRSDWVSPEFDRMRAACAGFMLEGDSYHAPWWCADEARPASQLEKQMELIRQYATAKGKSVNEYMGTKTRRKDASGACAGEIDAAAEERWRRFCMGGLLLTYRSGDLFTCYMSGSIRNAPAFPLADVGAPLTEAAKDADGVWTRPFERATVRVNFDASATRGGLPPQTAAFVPVGPVAFAAPEAHPPLRESEEDEAIRAVHFAESRTP